MGAGFGTGGAFTVMVTLAGLELTEPLFTTRVKVRTTGGAPGARVGAVKVGRATARAESVMPAGAVQAWLRGRPAESLLALPSSATVAPELTTWFGPALAMGAWIGAWIADAGAAPCLPPPPQAVASKSTADRA